MKFTISRGTMLFLMDLVYFYKTSDTAKRKTYEEFLKFLCDGYYDDDKEIKEWKKMI